MTPWPVHRPFFPPPLPPTPTVPSPWSWALGGGVWGLFGRSYHRKWAALGPKRIAFPIAQGPGLRAAAHARRRGCIRRAVQLREGGGNTPPPPRTPLLPFQCLGLTAKFLLRRLRCQEDSR